MYKCISCGEVFDEPAEWEESRGECFGSPAYEKCCGCPCCSSGFEEYNEEDEEDEDKEELTEEEEKAYLITAISNMRNNLERLKQKTGGNYNG